MKKFKKKQKKEVKKEATKKPFLLLSILIVGFLLRLYILNEIETRQRGTFLYSSLKNE